MKLLLSPAICCLNLLNWQFIKEVNSQGVGYLIRFRIMSLFLYRRIICIFRRDGNLTILKSNIFIEELCAIFFKNNLTNFWKISKCHVIILKNIRFLIPHEQSLSQSYCKCICSGHVACVAITLNEYSHKLYHTSSIHCSSHTL